MRPRSLLIGLLPAVSLVVAFWWAVGRPVPMADGGDGPIACLSYAPFRDSQTPFDPKLVIPPAQIAEDLRLLATRTRCVRTYSVDLGLAEVPRIARELGMNVMLGAWIGVKPSDNAREIRMAVELANAYPGTVKAVIVGNEVLLRREQSPEALIGMIRAVKEQVRVSVTYAEVWEFWQRNRQVADAVDFVTVHILPYWEDHPVAIDGAVPYVADTFRRMSREFAPKRLMIGETGWPSQGRMREGALPSPANQARFIREVTAMAAAEGIDYNLIEAFDQPWKRILEGRMGGHWGVFSNERTAKFPMQGPVSAVPDWRARLVVAIALAAVLLFGAARPGDLNARGWFVLSLAALAAASAIAWHGDLVLETTRHVLEWVLKVVALVLALAGAWILMNALGDHLAGHADRWPAPATAAQSLAALWRPFAALGAPATRLGLLLASNVLAMTYQTLCLVFDSRYRDFPTGLFVGAAIGFALLAFRQSPAPERPRGEEAWLAAVLAMGSIAVAIHEGPKNVQALAWSAVGLVMAFPWGWDALRRTTWRAVRP